MSGYIKLYRQTCDHPLFQKDMAYLGAWTWLLMNVAWKPHKTKHRKKIVYELARGQMPGSRKYIAEQIGWTEQRVRTFLAALATEGMIELKTLTNQRLTIITVCNFSKYQTIKESVNQEITTKQPVNNHTKEGEEGKEKNVLLPGEIEGLNGSTATFVEALGKGMNEHNPDFHCARTLLESNAKVHGPEKVTQAMLTLMALSASERINWAKAFPSYCMNAITEPLQQKTRESKNAAADAHNAHGRKILEELKREIV